jgi:hypothetical protein
MLDDAIYLAYVGLCLAVPFLWGLAIGRGLRKPQDAVGQGMAEAIVNEFRALLIKRKFAGSGCVYTSSHSARCRDGMLWTIELRLED